MTTITITTTREALNKSPFALSLSKGPAQNYWIFRSEWRSRLLYPLLRSCRNLLLKCLGKTKVNNLGGREQQVLLASCQARCIANMLY